MHNLLLYFLAKLVTFSDQYSLIPSALIRVQIPVDKEREKQVARKKMSD